MNTDWEASYKEGNTPWEQGAASPALVEYLESNPPLEGKILVPGCGLGHDVRALSRPDNEVTGIDIAPAAIKLAEAFPKTGRENFRVADLFDLPPGLRGCFDWVWEHTCFCAIDPPMRAQYVQGVSDALKPGGHLLAIFFLNPGNQGDGPPYGVTREELDGFFAGRFSPVREWKPGKAYPGREGREWMRLLQFKI